MCSKNVFAQISFGSLLSGDAEFADLHFRTRIDHGTVLQQTDSSSHSKWHWYDEPPRAEHFLSVLEDKVCENPKKIQVVPPFKIYHNYLS
jgi:hypothetical protein